MDKPSTNEALRAMRAALKAIDDDRPNTATGLVEDAIDALSAPVVAQGEDAKLDKLLTNLIDHAWNDGREGEPFQSERTTKSKQAVLDYLASPAPVGEAVPEGTREIVPGVFVETTRSGGHYIGTTDGKLGMLVRPSSDLRDLLLARIALATPPRAEAGRAGFTVERSPIEAGVVTMTAPCGSWTHRRDEWLWAHGAPAAPGGEVDRD